MQTVETDRLLEYISEQINHITTRPLVFGGREANLLLVMQLLDMEQVYHYGVVVTDHAGIPVTTSVWKVLTNGGPVLVRDEHFAMEDEVWGGLLRSFVAMSRTAAAAIYNQDQRP